MRQELFWWLAALVMAVVLSAGGALGYVGWSPLLFVLVALLVVARLGAALTDDRDRSWLPGLLLAAFGAKVLGVLARYFMVTQLYELGDSFSYHRAALDLVHAWRSLQVPVNTTPGTGTRFTEVVAALLYVPGVESMMMGFLIFASLSFIGLICFYVAFRGKVPTKGLRTYAMLLFFLPSLLFWPSSIGKDALMVLFLGVASLGASYLLQGRYGMGLLLLAPSLAGAGAIRPHVAVMVVSALVFTVVLGRRIGPKGGLGRLVVLVAASIALFSLAGLAMSELGLDQESLDEFLAEQERLTGQGGSAVVGAPVQNPLDFPEAFIRVLFRPLPHEAHNPPALLSSLEGALFLLLVLWRLPSLWSNIRVIRRYPYLLYSLIYTVQFIVAFSSILNLGIMARQRVQVLPLFLALLVGLAWEGRKKVELAPARLAGPVPAMAGTWASPSGTRLPSSPSPSGGGLASSPSPSGGGLGRGSSSSSDERAKGDPWGLHDGQRGAR
ncbi:MAG: hypothetical protein M3N51_08355 [Actinomycetota bacterium]|nr:hypothetical protein [Actinomycetota bacterium]